MDERKPQDGHHRRRRKPAAVRRRAEEHAPPTASPVRLRPARGRQIHWARHGIEFLVIVAGIMVSFLLNEWRQERQDRQEEQRLLGDLLQDMRQDSIIMSNELDDLEEVLERGRRLVRHTSQPIPADSVVQLLSPTISYVTVPFHQVTYHAMRATRSAVLIQDRALLRDILDLHESRYYMLRELFGIDRFLVLERMFPVTERHVLITTATPEDLDRLMADPEWRNLATHSLLFKGQIAAALRSEIAHGDTLMRRIVTQLAP